MDTKRLTKRQKNSIILWVIFNTFIFLILSYVLFQKYSSIQEINANIQDTKEIYNDIENYKKNWLDFAEFRSIKYSDYFWKDEYNLEILSNMDKDYFDWNFKWDWKDYIFFLDTKKEEVNNIKRESLNSWIINDISKIIKPYSQDPSMSLERDVITNFSFINFLERLFYTFNLNYSWNLKAWDFIKIQTSSDKSKKQKEENSLDSDIYYIPISLWLTWKKIDIVNFIHYLENVWRVNLLDNGELEVYSDDFLRKSFWWPIVLEWQDQSIDYNIYKNYVSEINSINFSTYLDSSDLTNKRDDERIEDYIKRTSQSEEEYTVSIDFNIYAKWLPFYDLELVINDFIEFYEKLKAYLEKRLSDNKLIFSKELADKVLINKLTTLNNYILTVDPKITNIKKNLVKKDSIDTMFVEISSYKKVILSFSDIIADFKESLNSK